MKKIYSLIVLALCVTGLSAQITEDFESMVLGTQISTSKWAAADITAQVVTDPIPAGQGNVMELSINNYNAGPILSFTLAAGKTLADYNSLTFKGYFKQGDVGYKDIVVQAYSSAPTNGAFFDADEDGTIENIIGKWNRAEGGSTGWESIDIAINQNDAYSQTLSGTVYIVFGINCSGTGDIGGTGVETIWYADDVTISPDVSTFSTAPKEEAKVSTSQGTINVVPQMGSKIAIYALSGAKVYSQDNAGGNVSVNVAPGLYIVVVDNTSTKVVVK